MFILVAWVDVAPFFSEVVVPVLAHSNGSFVNNQIGFAFIPLANR